RSVSMPAVCRPLAYPTLFRSYSSNASIGTLRGQRLPVTMELAIGALLIAVLTGIPLGVLAAVRQGRAPDAGAQALSMAGIEIPGFGLDNTLLQLRSDAVCQLL